MEEYFVKFTVYEADNSIVNEIEIPSIVLLNLILLYSDSKGQKIQITWPNGFKIITDNFENQINQEFLEFFKEVNRLEAE
jgi:hypothetical protein